MDATAPASQAHHLADIFPAQLHPLIAQQWRGRPKDSVVLAANMGYQRGWVHFAVRGGRDRDLVAFLAKHRPPGADAAYGNGHRLATGGARGLEGLHPRLGLRAGGRSAGRGRRSMTPSATPMRLGFLSFHPSQFVVLNSPARR